MKPADELLRDAERYRISNRLSSFEADLVEALKQQKALLDECERLATDLIRWDDREGRDPWEPLIANARATLAKLRGEG